MTIESGIKDIYMGLGISQIPRFLSTMDRNPLSPTYGCAHREYWLARAVDFPSSIAQYGILGLTLAYETPFPGNQFYQHSKVAQWIKAGLLYLTSIQHNDGSFDEFYPNERGWAGPTGFLLHAMNHAYPSIKAILTPEEEQQTRTMMLKAARFLGENDEIGVLANHHAMALLPLAETIELFDARELEPLFAERKADFLTYCHEEGWCLEYDGVDPGYLSATVTFLARLLMVRKDPELAEVARKALNFTQYFVYPDYHYGGTLGSRETFHFYSHGYELLGEEHPLALAQANHMAKGFLKGASVYPALQAERYFVYRIPEFLFSSRDVAKRPKELPLLPWQSKEDTSFYFEGAGIWGGKRGQYYAVVNLARGGNMKIFRVGRDDGEIITSDCGISGILEDGTMFTSSWIDPHRKFSAHEVEATVTQRCLTINSQTFDPVKMAVFRTGMAALGWHHKTAYHLKGLIRKVLMLRNKTVPITLRRHIVFNASGITVTDEITAARTLRIKKLLLGEELPVRYVPQSRYFQPAELHVKGYDLSSTEMKKLQDTGKLIITRQFE
ncbi:hypothetical protein KKF84_18170 [Myxococcota bacterium]|nr:hypothetical protein [Myxococcota bacterium]MBU1537249.1 hypothetical protein [Myxococcota bacterium]